MTAPSDQGQEVDGTDDQSYDAAEAAIGAAIAAVLIAWLLHPNKGRVAARRAQVDSSVGPAVRSLLARTAFGMYQQAGQPTAPGASDVEESYPAVMDRLFGWMEQGYQHLSSSETPDSSSADVRTFAGNLARSISTDAHTGVQDTVAKRLGAVWSEWVSRHDNKVRETHRDLDGQKIPFGSKFVSQSGALLSRPGDPTAPLSETLGCRCHLRYRLSLTDRMSLVRSNAFASVLATARVVDLVVSDETSRPIREWISRRWPDSRVTYLVGCKKCVSVWAGLLVASGLVPRPVVPALALSQAVIWVDRQDDRVGAIASAQARKLTRS